MSEDEFFDSLRGRKYIYLVDGGAGVNNVNVVAYNEQHAISLAKSRWWPSITATTCKEVTEAFHNLNNSLHPHELEEMEPGILRADFMHAIRKWKTI